MYDFQQFSAADQLFSSLDVLPQLAVGFIEGDVLSDAVEYLLMNRRNALTVGVESAADVDCLAGGQQLVSEDRQGVLNDPAGFSGAVVPIETMSSWFAEDGMESTEAGCASTLFSETIEAAEYCTIM